MKIKHKKFIVVLISVILISSAIIAISLDISASNYSASAARDLKKEIISYTGNNEYNDILMYSTVYNDQMIKIFEKMEFIIEYNGYSKYSIFKNERINEYYCRAIITRYARINGSEYIYNATKKEISYLGYDDNDLNSTQRAYIDPETKEYKYSENEPYFNNYLKQAHDATINFLN